MMDRRNACPLPGIAEPRLVRVILELAKFGPKMTAFERCEKLAEAREAYVELYPKSQAPGPRMSGAPIGFARYVSEREGTSARGINLCCAIHAGLANAVLARLRLSSKGLTMQHLKGLAALPPDQQPAALDALLSGAAPRRRPARTRAAALDLTSVPSCDLIAELWRRETASGGGVNDG